MPDLTRAKGAGAGGGGGGGEPRCKMWYMYMLEVLMYGWTSNTITPRACFSKYGVNAAPPGMRFLKELSEIRVGMTFIVGMECLKILPLWCVLLHWQNGFSGIPGPFSWSARSCHVWWMNVALICASGRWPDLTDVLPFSVSWRRDCAHSSHCSTSASF